MERSGQQHRCSCSSVAIKYNFDLATVSLWSRFWSSRDYSSINVLVVNASYLYAVVSGWWAIGTMFGAGLAVGVMGPDKLGR